MSKINDPQDPGFIGGRTIPIIKKEPHELWYYFGKCNPRPTQIHKGTLPMLPYKSFDTKEECQRYIDRGKTFDPVEQSLRQLK